MFQQTLNNREQSGLVNGSYFEGYRLMNDKGPFVHKHLEKIVDVMQLALGEHPRTFAFRIDLRLPSDWGTWDERRLIDRFISSFKAKIIHSRDMAKRRSPRAHQTAIRYVWAREEGQGGRPHYHFVIFLNNDAFNNLGTYQLGRDNLFNRMTEAWASALGIAPDAAEGLVHIAKNAVYRIKTGDLHSQNELFHRASYLAKYATKVRGSRHCFGGSRG